MRKLFFSILTIVSILLFTNVERAEATCPPGYSSRLDTITFNGCQYEVTICYQCFVSHQGDVSIDRIKPLPNQAPPCDVVAWHDFNNAINFIRNYIQSTGYYFNKLCSTMPIVPCNEGQKNVVTYKEYFCWRMTLNGFEHCDDENYCEVTVEYCYDVPTSTLTTNMLSANTVGTINCPLYTGNEPFGVCFSVNTKCNP